MGDPKKPRKQYERPRRLWDKQRIDADSKLVETYGLKNMREAWKAQSWVRIKRQNARKLLALSGDEKTFKEKELLESLQKLGILRENALVDDVLALTTKDFLERRLQTIVWRKGFANTPKQARQFIVHGHVAVNGQRVNRPSFMVTKAVEGTITWYREPMQLTVSPKEDPKTAFEAAKPVEGFEEQSTEAKVQGE